LEILANDVRCTHGATPSRLNQEELFYLLSRGIEKKSAESLISLGFLEEIIDKIPDEDLATKTRNLVCSHFNYSSHL
jgi:Fe-S cluster assembly protein SufD